MPKKVTPIKTIYQIKITLLWGKPPIWRRFQVDGNVTLGKLHRIIQPLMGWWDGHLHQFGVGNACYATNEVLENHDAGGDENKVKLSAVLKKVKEKIIYEYDFGDGWEHELLLEEILEPKEGVHYPVCLAGKRSCPPEDCGGIGGYQNLLAILKDPKHPEYKEMREWAPEGFDSEEFELDEVNRAFRYVK